MVKQNKYKTWFHYEWFFTFENVYDSYFETYITITVSVVQFVDNITFDIHYDKYFKKALKECEYKLYNQWDLKSYYLTLNDITKIEHKKNMY